LHFLALNAKLVSMLTYEPIGLDLSLTSTGVAIGRATWAIATKGLRGEERLIYIRDLILEAISDLEPEPDNQFVVFVEGYSFASRNSHAHALGELGGVIRVALHEAEIPFVEVPPTCRAKFATGKGNASKSEVVSAISARTSLIWDGPGNEDRCDAWILQEMGRTILGQSTITWPTKHLEALQKLDLSSIITPE